MNFRDNLLVSIGAVVGGAVGIFLFGLLMRQGFYALILPGALAGIGAGLFRNHSKVMAIFSGLVGLTAGVLAEWYYRPFTDDSSFGYFIRHFNDLRGLTRILIAVGSVVAFWIPFRRSQSGALAAPTTPPSAGLPPR